MKRLTLFGLFLLISTASIAADQIRLYKQYIVGTPKTHLQKIHKLEDCSIKYEQGTLCMQNHSLSGENTEIAFRFLKDQLVSIALMMPLSDVSKIKKMFYVLKTQFDLVLIEDGKERLDIIEISANTFAKQEFTKLIAEFENNAYKEYNIKYTFISKDEFKTQSLKARNFSEIFKDAPTHMRAATYSVGRKDGQVIGTISFIVPGITQAYLDQNPIVEDF
jgi:glutathione peroxidase-family protein